MNYSTLKENPLLPLTLGFIIIAILSRLLPHPPNATALTSLSIILGMRFNKWQAMLMVVFTMAVSDSLLSLWRDYPLFGVWSLFTYSGFALITLGASVLLTVRSKMPWLIIYVLGSGVGFWLWTNLGTWLTTDLYPHNLMGLLACYEMAIPFLTRSLVNDVIGLLFFLSLLELAKSSINLTNKTYYHHN